MNSLVFLQGFANLTRLDSNIIIAARSQRAVGKDKVLITPP